MKVKYWKPEASVLPMQAETHFAESPNQGAGTETPGEGTEIGGEEEPGKGTLWDEKEETPGLWE